MGVTDYDGVDRREVGRLACRGREPLRTHPLRRRAAVLKYGIEKDRRARRHLYEVACVAEPGRADGSDRAVARRKSGSHSGDSCLGRVR